MTSLVVQWLRHHFPMQGVWVQYLGGKDPQEEGTASHSSVLAWRIPGTEEPGGLQSMGLQRVEHNWSDLAHRHTSPGTLPNPGTETVSQASPALAGGFFTTSATQEAHTSYTCIWMFRGLRMWTHLQAFHLCPWSFVLAPYPGKPCLLTDMTPIRFSHGSIIFYGVVIW